MIKIKFKKIIFSILFMLSFLCVSNINCFSQLTVNAQTNLKADSYQENLLRESVVPKGVITEENHAVVYGIGDNLYKAICAMRNTLLGYTNLTSFSTHFFFEEITSIDISGLPESTKAQATRMKNDLENGILNLTTGNDASYACLKNIEPIQSIDGLKNLDLSKITKLYLDNNAISSIRSEVFVTLGNLTHLSISGNKLETFKVYIPNISFLDLHSNKLTKVDLRGLQNNAIVDLSFNNITSTSKIQSDNNLSFLNLSFNLLTDTDDIRTYKNSLNTECKLVLLLQNTSKSLKYKDRITIYNDDVVNDFSASFKYYEGNELDENAMPASSFNGIICSANPSSSSQNFEELVVPAGRVHLQFTFSNSLDSLLNTDLKYVLNNGFTYAIRLNQPIIDVMVNGKQITDFKQKKNMDLFTKYEISESDIQYDNISEHISYSLKIDKTVYQKSNYTIENNGTYYVTASVLFDGIESESVSIKLIKHDPFALNLGIFLIVLIFIVITVVVFIVKWLRDGGEIAPLSDKEIYKSSRKNNRNDMGENITKYNKDKDYENLNKDDEVDL